MRFMAFNVNLTFLTEDIDKKRKKKQDKNNFNITDRTHPIILGR